MYELQLFSKATGRYVRNHTSDDPQDLMKLGRMVHDGPRRVVSVDRKKPLPLKPRTFYRSPRRYKLGSKIEAPGDDAIIQRALDYYRQRAEKGERKIPVYFWRGSTAGYQLTANLRPGNKHDGTPKFLFIDLDPNEPGCAFGPDDYSEEIQHAVAV